MGVSEDDSDREPFAAVCAIPVQIRVARCGMSAVAASAARPPGRPAARLSL